MSYILDALKKSEKERRQGSEQDPLTFQEHLLREPKKRSLWPYLIVIALSLNAAVFSIWSVFSYPKRSVIVTKTNPQRTVFAGGEKSSLPSTTKDDGMQAIRDVSEAKPNPQAEKTVSKNKEDARKSLSEWGETGAEKRSPERRETSGESGRKNVALTVDSRETSVASAPDAARSDTNVPPSSNRIYVVSELPLSIRQGLPAFSVSVFLHSDDQASSIVRVNGKTLKEGQYLAEGLKLEKIIANGPIFSYRNYRFLVSPE